jgi:hypothetical protein
MAARHGTGSACPHRQILELRLAEASPDSLKEAPYAGLPKSNRHGYRRKLLGRTELLVLEECPLGAIKLTFAQRPLRKET